MTSRKAGQTDTIKRAGVKQAKLNILELIEVQRNKGDMQNPTKDHSE